MTLLFTEAENSLPLYGPAIQDATNSHTTTTMKHWQAYLIADK